MRKRFNIRKRLVMVSGALFLILCVLLGRSVYLAASSVHQNRTNLMLMTRVPHSLTLLEEQNRKIEQVTANIDQYTLSEIRGVLNETSRVASTAGIELRAQADAWEKIRAKVNVDATAYREVQQSLKAAEQAKSVEIVRLNALLKESTKVTFWDNVVALLSSFALGVVSSVAASMLYDKYQRWNSRIKGDGGS